MVILDFSNISLYVQQDIISYVIFYFIVCFYFYKMCQQSHHSADDIHYAALHLNLPRRSKKQRANPDNECIYSGVNL